MTARLLAVTFKALNLGLKVTILTLCRPSDTTPGQMQAEYEQNLNLYGTLVDALGHYSDSGWSIRILPWVVGAQKLVQERDMLHALKCLEVSKRSWRPIIENKVLASISALAFMHIIHFSPPITPALCTCLSL